ncbi:sulfurtransferase TusA family protein [Helicobacter aurati]|uniref:sulfurtransferase TusA family protein n=1 Tax=Helicobacter aurati TaxID=137778 RepID=UPI001F1658E5|nr:sulfurtransferase TusA family protein [Helicobacter aurati]
MSSNFYTIPRSVLQDDYEFFASNYKDFCEGRLDELTFKTIRVSFGIYEQREPNTYMVRIKTNGGVISPSQLITLSELARDYADPKIHVTTRGGVQLHYAKLENLQEIMQKLHAVGLTGRGSGGNTVRNIVGDPLSGIAKNDIFDILPYANELTTRMLGLKDSFNLPRKFKIAFSSSSADRAHATITDIGYIAKIKNQQRGFSVWIAGGMGAQSRLGFKLFDFLPENEIYLLAQAVKQVFDRTGNRKNKHAARLRFVAKKLGEEELARLIHEEMAALRQSKDWEITIEPRDFTLPTIQAEQLPAMTQEQTLWWNRFVREQKQAGYYYVKIPLQLGDIPYESAKNLAEKLLSYNAHETTICFTSNQNMYLRHLRPSQLLALYPLISDFSIQSSKPTIIGDMVACTGAATCQLGITRPRGAIVKIEEYLRKKHLDLDSLQGFRINMSGCPNSCGNHATANLGFFGKVLREGERPYPAYNVLVGAVIEEGKTRFARKIAEVAAFYVPQFVYEVLKTYIACKAEYPSFESWVDSVGEEIIKDIAEKYKQVPSFEDDKNPYFDYSSDSVFSLKGRGSGECSAGMYDLIEADKKALNEAIKQAQVDSNGDYTLIRLLACRMLLVAKGEEARDEVGVLRAFQKLYIDSGLIDRTFSELLIGKADARAIDLGKAVIALYATMDNSLKFAKEREETGNSQGQSLAVATHSMADSESSSISLSNHLQSDTPQTSSSSHDSKLAFIPCYAKSGDSIHLDKESINYTDNTQCSKADSMSARCKDLRGVACPINFVRAKQELSLMQSGEVLEILLDNGEPIENVPLSLQSEGHKVLLQTQEDTFWRVKIQKI